MKYYLTFILLLFCSFLYSANIATIYSDFMDSGYKNILVDELKSNHKVTPCENKNLENLIKNINNFEMIITNPGYNYTNSVDWTLYSQELNDYINNGGIIIVSDANYPQQNQWIGAVFGLDFISGDAGGDELQSPNVFSKNHPLLENVKIPNLPWCNVIKVSRDYNILLTDKQNRPVLVYKPIGKGLLVISSMYIHYGFPSVEFINNLLKYKNDESRFKSVSNNNFEKNPVLDLKENKTNLMSPLLGNSLVKTEWTATENNEGINFNIICYDNDIINASASTTFRDGPVWNDDSIEIFIKPPYKNKQNGDYYHYLISYNNVQCDECVQDVSIDTYFISNVKQENDKWILNVFIPFASMGINNKTELEENNGKYDFKFNICRSYHPGKNNSGLYSWAYMTSPAFHTISNWGTLKINPFNISPYVVDNIKINSPKTLSIGKNEFSVNLDKNLKSKIIDLTENKTFNIKNNKALVEFTTPGEHNLMALVYNNDLFIGASNILKVKVEDILSVKTIYPYYRNIVQSKDPDKTFRLLVNIGNTKDNNLKLQWFIKSNKNEKSGQLNVQSNSKYEIKCDISKLKVGEYAYEILLSSNKNILRKEIRNFKVLSPSDYEITFDRKRVCYINGEPYFPIILYHSGEWMMNYLNQNKKPETPALEIKSMLKDIANHGFNGVITQGPFPIPQNYFDNTKNAGLKFNFEVGANIDENILNQYRDLYNKNQTGIFYYSVDEPIGDRLKTAINEYEILKELDPHRPIGAAVCHGSVFKEANNAFDIMMPDNYIIRHNNKEGRPSFRGLLSFIKSAMEPNDYRKPLWPVPQAFGWNFENPAFGVPTREELRCQMYFYLVYGATGFAWYGYTSPERDETAPYNLWHLPSSDLWEYFTVLNKEMKDFSKIIINGESMGPLKGNNDLVHSNVWKYNNKYYSIIVNPERETQEVEFNINKKVKPYFDYKYNIENNKFILKPLECVIIYY